MKIRLGGVPEHFNLPWHIAKEEGVFESLEVDFTFIDFPGGTGAMIDGLKTSAIDLALLLTEGAVKFINENPDYQIIKFYVDSPLLWGVHLPVKSELQNLQKYPFAISRFGSGSHLMAYVYAQNENWDIDQLKFDVIQNLAGLREYYKEGKEGIFLWEKYTTKPYVDKGEMQLVDVCPTPWPCFVLVGKKDFIDKNLENLESFLDGINICLDTFKQRTCIEEEIADSYGLQLNDVEEWFAKTEWNSTNEISKTIIDTICNTLMTLGIINKKIEAQNIISSLSILVD